MFVKREVAMRQAPVYVLYLLFGTFVMVASVIRPAHNWDAIAHVGSAKKFETSDVEVVHSFAYDKLKEYVPEADYQRLVGGGGYRGGLS